LIFARASLPEVSEASNVSKVLEEYSVIASIPDTPEALAWFVNSATMDDVTKIKENMLQLKKLEKVGDSEKGHASRHYVLLLADKSYVDYALNHLSDLDAVDDQAFLMSLRNAAKAIIDNVSVRRNKDHFRQLVREIDIKLNVE
jgi:RecJ-like exonuclease